MIGFLMCLIMVIGVYYISMLAITINSFDAWGVDLEDFFGCLSEYKKSWIPFYALKLIFNAIRSEIKDQFNEE